MKKRKSKVVGMNYALTLKVKLFHNKRVWRSVELSSNDTLGDLHETIFDAFDRYDEHLFSFYFPEKPTTSHHKIMLSKEYTLMMGDMDLPFSNQKPGDALKARIRKLQLKEKQKFYYLFDFGDE